jgi:hypothetical protein
MDRRYKKRAIVGVGLWFLAPPLCFFCAIVAGLLLKWFGWAQDAFVAVFFLSFLALQYFAFFWGGSHLAKAKGYSNGMLWAGILWPFQIIILAVLLFGLTDRFARPSRRGGKSQRHRDESLVARVVRFRRNALVAILLGLFGIFLALTLFFVPIGPSVSHQNSMVAAILVFVPGYAATIYGCWWWVKAKNWHEAVVFIGLIPVFVLLVPYVRLIYLAVPLLLPATMVLMPIILVGVVAVLPDKSGLPRHQR